MPFVPQLASQSELLSSFCLYLVGGTTLSLHKGTTLVNTEKTIEAAINKKNQR
jgi:hypothetical protein